MAEVTRRESHEVFPLDRLEAKVISSPLLEGEFLVPRRHYERELHWLVEPQHYGNAAPQWMRRGCTTTAYLLSEAKTLEHQVEVLLGALSHDRYDLGLHHPKPSGWPALCEVAAAARAGGLLEEHGGWHHASKGATLDFSATYYEPPVDAERCARLTHALASYLALNYILVTVKPEVL